MRKTNKVSDYQRVAFLLQGGGALGSYQAGVLEGLTEADIYPTWVAGISIGSLNCAIIAGNPPEQRVEKLHEFWTTICRPPSTVAGLMASTMEMFAPGATDMMEKAKVASEKMFGTMAAMHAIIEGQQGFFTPRLFAPGVGTPAETSFYETNAIISTLERLADFDRINQSDLMRVSIGSTNVRTGNFEYFDNTKIELTPHHFLASGALPPGFPAVEIDGEFYWDGGCVSNTPLHYIMTSLPRMDTLIFQVDLWSAAGELPRNVFQVMDRMKDIQYSSKTRSVTTAVEELHNIRKSMQDLIERIPAAVRKKDPYFDQVFKELNGARNNCIQLIYKNKASEGHYKDVEFSHETMRDHWKSGLLDVRNTLEDPTCLEMPADGVNFVTYDVHHRPT